MSGTGTPSAPGTAIRRYLAAIRDRGPLSIDWESAPTSRKRYPEAPRVRLPWPPGPAERPPAPARLVGDLLRWLLGLTRVVWSHQVDDQGGPLGRPPVAMPGRPAPSGGALYPIEAYVATGVPGVPAALYHYDPVQHALERVRDGDHGPALATVLGVPAGTRTDVTIVLSAVFARSMFKYGDFAYRLICQEVGVLLAQALTVGERLGLTSDVHLLFPGAGLDRLLGLDGAREAALAALTCVLPTPITAGPSDAPEAYPRETPTARESRPLPRPMPAGPAAELHRACAAARPGAPGPPAGVASPGPRPTGAEVALPDVRAPLADGVERRCSPQAGYRPQPISARALAGVLRAAARRGPAHLPAGAGEPVGAELCLVALRVEGLPPAAYRYDPERRVLCEVSGEHVATLGQGRLRPNTRAALRDAAAVLVPVGDPLAGVARYGDLWYRLQQIETGVVVQQATLAAFALGLAARIHSDGTNDATDRVLGLTTTARCGLSFLVMGTPRTGGPLLARRIPSATAKEVIAAT